MKVAVECESALLQKSLEMFLGTNLSSLKQCDLVLRDTEIMDSYHMLYISSESHADIIKPFTRSQLYLSLEKFYKKLENIHQIQEEVQELETKEPNDFKILEDRIDKLTLNYKTDVLNAVKAFYSE